MELPTDKSSASLMTSRHRLRDGDQNNKIKADSDGPNGKREEFDASVVLLPKSAGSFQLSPELILFPPKTNLYNTPLSWLVKRNRLSTYRGPLLTYLDSETEVDEDGFANGSGHARKRSPDFASNNRVLRELLSWQLSDRLVSIVVHRIGETLVVQSMSPMFTGPPALPQHAASLISGFDIRYPTSSDNEGTTQNTSLEEQARLRALATNDLLSQQRRKKNSQKVRHAQLASKLHCKTLEQNGFTALSPEDCITVHQWQHRDHNVVLSSDLAIYSYQKHPTSLDLRDTRDGPHSKATVARLFLDNIMAGVPQLAVCYHEDGVIRKYETFKTHEIPSKVNEQDPLEIGELEKGATALLSFLKLYCTEDLSTHWLFKGTGEQIARLWRLDPVNDCSMDMNFRENLLYQLGMLCVRAASTGKNNSRERILLEKAIELIDASAKLSSSRGTPVRRPLRAALRERLVDVIIGDHKAGIYTNMVPFSDLLAAILNIDLAYQLLVEDETARFVHVLDGQGHASSSRMITQAECRLTERGLTLSIMLSKSIPILSSSESSTLYGDVYEDDYFLQVQQALETSIQRAKLVILSRRSELDFETSSSSVFATSARFLVELLYNAKMALGEILMRRARTAALLLQRRQTIHQPSAHAQLEAGTAFGGDFGFQAENLLNRAINECFSLDEIPTLSVSSIGNFANANEASDMDAESEDNVAEFFIDTEKLGFLRGNALNELGKLFLSRGAVVEARDAFSRGVMAFRVAHDLNNVAVLRCNIAHTYRIASQSSEDGVDKTKFEIFSRKKALLELALNEIEEAMKECAQHSTEWEQRLSSELCKTLILLGVATFANSQQQDEEAVGNDLKHAIALFQRAAEFAKDSAEVAAVNFHLAQVRSKGLESTDITLAKRNFERATEKMVKGSAFRLHVLMLYGEFMIDKCRESAEKVIRTVVLPEDFRLDSSLVAKADLRALQTKVQEFLTKIIKQCILRANKAQDRENAKRAYRELLETLQSCSGDSGTMDVNLNHLIEIVRTAFVVDST